jgi:hypothetical protein
MLTTGLSAGFRISIGFERFDVASFSERFERATSSIRRIVISIEQSTLVLVLYVVHLVRNSGSISFA